MGPTLKISQANLRIIVSDSSGLVKNVATCSINTDKSVHIPSTLNSNPIWPDFINCSSLQ